jgi:hypothetical protein
MLFLITACKPSASWQKSISASDSLVINFNEPNSNTINNTVSTTEKKAIQKLAGFLKTKSSKEFKCGYDGNMMFYEEGKLTADVSFNYSGEDCKHFMLLENGELLSIEMKNEAADFLKSLREGKNWY